MPMSRNIGRPKFAFWTALLGAILAPLGGMRAQPAKSIEVASVRPSHDSSAGSNLDSVRGRLTATNITVRELIRFAYSVQDFQIERAPQWLDTARFDIAAKKASAKANSLENERSLVRELLADRFQLTTHRESKQIRGFLLVVAKGGPKLPKHDDAGPKIRGACGRLVGRRVTTDNIAAMLSRQVDREVMNRTGLAGEYDIELDFTPDSGPCRAAGESRSAPAADGSEPPSIYTALQQQLGLRLESGKTAVELLVIDRVERPSEN